MDNSTNQTLNNGNKPSLHKSRSNFGNAAVAKSDVGDFQEGYFVMADMPSLPVRNKNYKTPERNQRKNVYQQSRERSTKDLEVPLQRESDTNVSNVRLTTSPTRSPPRNKRISNSHSPQRNQQTTTNFHAETPSSPHNKPRKAHSHAHLPQHDRRFVERSESTPSFSLESNSPPKDTLRGTSPPSSSPPKASRWAGPAFSNAPPPSSLPIPDFPPFNPSLQPAAADSSASHTLSSPSKPVQSPSPSGPSFASQPLMYPDHRVFSHQPHSPVYVPIGYHGYPMHLAYEIPSQPASLAQLSTDLRRMLNISEQPIFA